VTHDERTDGDRFLVPAIIASQFAPPFLFSGVAIGLPELGAELGADATALGLVETSFLAGSLAFLLPIGRLADATDKRALYRFGVLGFVATAIAIAACSSVPWILVLRFLQGALSAVFTVTGPAILADVVPPAQRGRAYGASIGVIYAGLTLGPVAAGLSCERFGWRSIFVVGAALLLLLYAPVHSRLRGTFRLPGRDAVDLESVALMLASVCALVLGANAIDHLEVGIPAVLGSAALAACFLLRQRRLAKPLVDLRAVAGNPPLLAALIVQLALYLNAYCTTYLQSLALQVSYGHDARIAGFVIALGSVLMALLAPVAGSWSDRMGKRSLANVGVACVLVAALLGLGVDESSTLVEFVTIVAFQGVGFALFSSPNMALIMNAVPPDATSSASALAAMARSTGMVFGMLIVGAFVAMSIGNDPVARHGDALIGVLHRTYGVLAFVSALALAVGIAASRHERARRTTPHG
jgi:MFS family permease